VSRHGRGGGEKNPYLCWEPNHGVPLRSLVNILSELSWLQRVSKRNLSCGNRSIQWLGYGLDERGSIPGRGQLWGPPKLPMQWVQGDFSSGVGAWSWQLIFI